MVALAIDLGTKRVGIALGYSDPPMATPHTVVSQMPAGEMAAHLRPLVEEYRVERLVVGLPRNMDGSEGEAARAARELGTALGEALGLPVTMWDERLTTREAHERLRAAGKSARDSRDLVDMVAAQVLLEDWLRSGAP